jgi:hypothetical protein
VKTKPKKVVSSTENTMALFTPEQLEAAHEKYLQEQAERQKEQPKTRAEILLEVVADYPDATVAELAEAASRSVSWVRKVLRQAGVTVAKAPRHKKASPAPEVEREQTE